MKHWWFSLIAIPPISIAVLMLLLYAGYPIAFHILPDSFFVIRLLMVAFAVSMIFIQQKASGAKLWVLFGIWTLFTGLAFVTDHGIFEGDQKTALAFHYFNFQFFAVMFSALYASLDKKKQTP